MRNTWLHGKTARRRRHLLVFCNGWGMDGRPFRLLGTRDYDVLHLYDFRDFEGAKRVLDLAAGYDRRVLLGWSMGVWAGQRLFAHRPQSFTATIAVNGTLCPIDETRGIPRKLFAGTLENWSELTRRKFYHRLCGGGAVEDCFLKSSPARSLADQRQELAVYLETADCLGREQSIYRLAIVSDRDRIVPTANQLAFWGPEVRMLAGSHFPFYRWSCWDDLLLDLQAMGGGEDRGR